MNKGTKLGIILCAAGVLVVGLSWLIAGGNYKRYESNKIAREKKTYTCSSDIDALVAIDKDCDVIVKIADVDKPQISYYEDKDYEEVTVKETGKTLSFERKVTFNKKNFLSISFSANELQDNTEILLPRTFKGDINLGTLSGDISVISVEAGNFLLNASSGDIYVSDVKSDYITLSTLSGEIFAKGMQVAGEGVISSASGDIAVEDYESGSNLKTTTNSGETGFCNVKVKELECTAASGEVIIKDTKVDSIKSNTNSGEVTLAGLEPAKEAHFNTSSGDISGSIKGTESDYSIAYTTGSGDCNLSNSSSGNVGLEFHTGSGDIEIGFRD